MDNVTPDITEASVSAPEAPISVRGIILGALAVVVTGAMALFMALQVGMTRIEVVVTDATGGPLISARVLSIIQPEGQSVLDGTTSEAGNMLIFNPVQPGEYKILVTRPDYAPQTTTVSVGRGRTAQVTFALSTP